MALRDFGVGVGDGFEHSFAEVSGLVAVAQFEGFVLAGGCAGRHRGAAALRRSEGQRRLQRWDCRANR